MTQLSDSALAEALALFGRLSTATISDAMDTLGVPAGCPGINALVPNARTVGVAYTVQYAPVEPGGAGGKAPDYLEEAPAGSVIVSAPEPAGQASTAASVLAAVETHSSRNTLRL